MKKLIFVFLSLFKSVEAGSLTYLLDQLIPSIDHPAGEEMFPTFPNALHFSFSG